MIFSKFLGKVEKKGWKILYSPAGDMFLQAGTSQLLFGILVASWPGSNKQSFDGQGNNLALSGRIIGG